MIELYTFTVSHFCEKARWALDLSGAPYQEKLLLPGLHLWTTRRLAAQSTVPILVHDKRVIQGSSAILDHIQAYWPSTPLPHGTAYSTTRGALEAEFDRALGHSTQRLLYAALSADREEITRLWCDHGPSWAPTFYGLAFPFVDAVVKRMYHTTDTVAVAEAHQQLGQCLDHVESLLQRTPYLAGDRPGREDLVMASFLAPLDFPEEHPAAWPANAKVAETFAAYRQRPAIAHMKRVYRELRHLGSQPYRLGALGTHEPLR